MIAALRGVIAEKEANRVVLDVRGVGYEVWIPVSTFYELGVEGEEAFLHIHTHVKEDALSLYGFSSGAEKKLFSLLIQVSGIGPKLAITVLSGLPPDDFVRAISGGDLRRLNAIPGIGKKTAERLILELRDKVAGWSPKTAAAVPAGSVQADVVSALVNLGYSRADAETRVSKAAKSTESRRFEDLLKVALSQ